MNTNALNHASANAVSAWSPFAHKAFAVLSIATVVSHIGTWMGDVGSGWLMASIAPSPIMVSLVQAANALPVFLLAIPAGALADIVDKRKLLLAANILMLITALSMGLTTYFGAMTPLLLLAFTLLFGVGTAIVVPAWQSIVPSLVPTEMLHQAVTINSVGINVSRAIGPALGGLIIAAMGIAWPFLFNAASYLFVVIALLWWTPQFVTTSHLPTETFINSLVSGIRFAKSSRPLKATLWRAVAFFLFASAYWALLPLLVRLQLDAGPQVYGVLLAAIGLGAIACAFLLPVLSKSLSHENAVMVGQMSTAVVLVMFALSNSIYIAIVASFLAGMSWLAVLTNLNVSAQTALPNWVKARGLSVFITVFFGSMTFGSIAWGQIADVIGLQNALLVASVGVLLGYASTRTFKLHQGEGIDFRPALHWPEPTVYEDVDNDRGPVMITIEYLTNPSESAHFLQTLSRIETARRQDGAYAWGVFEDVSTPGRYVEYFMEHSWLEHLRHHERVSQSTKAIQAAIRAFHVGALPPKVTHLVSPLSRHHMHNRNENQEHIR